MSMAATYTALVPPAQEDDMEISSPNQRAYDGEDDIDFDAIEIQEEPTVPDEQMQEGDERPSTANDEEMSEGGHHIEVREEVMGEDAMPGEDEDEDLIDYSDDEVIDDVQHEPQQSASNLQDLKPLTSTEFNTAVDVSTPEGLTAAGATNKEDEVVEPSTQAHPGEQQQEVNLELTNVVSEAEQPHLANTTGERDDTTIKSQVGDQQVNYRDPEHSEDFANVENLTADQEPENATSIGHNYEQNPEHETSNLDPSAEHDAQSTDDRKQAPVPIDASVLRTSPDLPGTPTDTGLHPTTLYFKDLEMSLFKSSHEPNGLLKDDNLASLSLAELMQNCRERLSLKLGEDIPEDQELVLAFDSIACTLVENSRATFDTSLNDILDVFLQLHQNDGVEDIPPFSLTLSHQLKFSSSLDTFKTAAAGGQGMSSFAYLFENYDDDYQADDGQYNEQDYDEHGAQEGTDYNEEYHDATEDDYPHGEKEYNNPDLVDQVDNYQDYNQDAEQEHHDENDNSQENDYETKAFQDGNQDGKQENGFNSELQDDVAETNEVFAPTSGDASEPHDDAQDQQPNEDLQPSDEAIQISSHQDDHQAEKGESIDFEIDFGSEIDWEDESVLTAGSSDLALAPQTNESTDLTEADEVDERSAARIGNTLSSDEANGLDGVTANKNPVIPQEDHEGNHSHQAEALDSPSLLENGADENFSTAHTDAGFAENPANEQLHGLSDAADGDGAEPASESYETDIVDATTSAITEVDEDTIDFDDDTQEQYAARKASEAQTGIKSNSPSTPNGKRSYDEHAEDEIDFDSPDTKKARAM